MLLKVLLGLFLNLIDSTLYSVFISKLLILNETLNLSEVLVNLPETFFVNDVSLVFEYSRINSSPTLYASSGSETSNEIFVDSNDSLWTIV